MLKPNTSSSGLAYSDQSKTNHENSKELDALNDGFESEDEEDLEPQPTYPAMNSDSVENKKNDKKQDVPVVKPEIVKPEKYDDLASSGT